MPRRRTITKTTRRRNAAPAVGVYKWVHRGPDLILQGPDNRRVLSIRQGQGPDESDAGMILDALNRHERLRLQARADYRDFAGNLRRAGSLDELGETLRKRNRRNPPRGGTLIYDRLRAIEAEKKNDPGGPGKPRRHVFPKRLPASQVIGLPDGSLYIARNGAPLWGYA